MESYNKGKTQSLGYAFGHSEDTTFKSNTGSHISPEVIHRESANLALAPEKVKEIMRNLRNSGSELDESGKYGYNKLTSRKLGFNSEIPVDKIEYGKSAVIDKKKMKRDKKELGTRIHQLLKAKTQNRTILPAGQSCVPYTAKSNHTHHDSFAAHNCVNGLIRCMGTLS